MSCRKFIERYRVHQRSFNNEDTNSTTLSKKLWELKHEQKITSVEFKIKKLSQSYTPGNKFCHLCISEKQLIKKELKSNEKKLP